MPFIAFLVLLFLKKNLEFCHNISIFETAIIDGL